MKKMDLESEETPKCRLCFYSGNIHINIFNEDGYMQNVAQIIEEHFQCKVNESDCLPKMVCSECWTKTETFHNFHRTVKLAHNEFMKKFIKNELEVDEGVYPPQTHEFIASNFVACNIEFDNNRHDADIKSKPQQENESSVAVAIEANESRKRLRIPHDNIRKTRIARMKQNRRLRRHKIIESDSENFDSNSEIELSGIKSNNLKAKKTSSMIVVDMTMHVSPTQKNRIIEKYFDMSCDACDTFFKSVIEARAHYKAEHNEFDGYVKCCGQKIKENRLVNDHVMWHLNPEIFKCDLCGSIKKTRKNLYVHKMYHVKKNTLEFECELCERRFITNSVMKKHIENVHVKPKSTFVCEFCKKRFPHKENLEMHLQVMHSSGAATGICAGFAVFPLAKLDPLSSLSKQHVKLSEEDKIIVDYFDMTCDVCNIKLDSLDVAKSHYTQEHNMHSGYVKCCDLKLEEQYLIDDHIKWHLNPEMFKCDLCGKIMNNRRSFRVHKANHRANEVRKHVCDLCDKRFATKAKATIHIMMVHVKPEPKYPCDVCTKRYTTMDSLKKHKKIVHTTGGDKICEFCAKTFKSEPAFRRHMQTIHSNTPPEQRERIQCHICGSWLGDRYRLKTHMLIHTSGPQKCDICGKFSSTPNALKIHIKSIHAERTHKCHLCEKAFKNDVVLRGHIATHTGERLYSCSYCIASFTWRSDKYNHQKKAHPAEWSRNRAEKLANANV